MWICSLQNENTDKLNIPSKIKLINKKTQMPKVHQGGPTATARSPRVEHSTVTRVSTSPINTSSFDIFIVQVWHSLVLCSITLLNSIYGTCLILSQKVFCQNSFLPLVLDVIGIAGFSRIKRFQPNFSETCLQSILLQQVFFIFLLYCKKNVSFTFLNFYKRN